MIAALKAAARRVIKRAAAHAASAAFLTADASGTIPPTATAAVSASGVAAPDGSPTPAEGTGVIAAAAAAAAAATRAAAATSSLSPSAGVREAGLGVMDCCWSIELEEDTTESRSVEGGSGSRGLAVSPSHAHEAGSVTLPSEHGTTRGQVQGAQEPGVASPLTCCHLSNHLSDVPLTCSLRHCGGHEAAAAVGGPQGAGGGLPQWSTQAAFSVHCPAQPCSKGESGSMPPGSTGIPCMSLQASAGGIRPSGKDSAVHGIVGGSPPLAHVLQEHGGKLSVHSPWIQLETGRALVLEPGVSTAVLSGSELPREAGLIVNASAMMAATAIGPEHSSCTGSEAQVPHAFADRRVGVPAPVCESAVEGSARDECDSPEEQAQSGAHPLVRGRSSGPEFMAGMSAGAVDGAVHLQYMYDGDCNGVCFYAGTSFGKHPWMNPVLLKARHNCILVCV